MKFEKFSKYCFVLTLIIIVGGCSPKLQLQNEHPLINKGVLPVSTSSAFLGSNLFLGHNMTNSAILLEFVRSRGGPSAMELIQSTFGELRMVLYYPYQNEVYVADKAPAAENEWLVSGPYQLTRNQFRALRNIIKNKHVEPPFLVNGVVVSFAQTREPVKASVPVVKPTPVPTPVVKHRKPAPSKPKEDVVSPLTPAIPNISIPLNADQQAIAMAQGYAERSPTGDIIHTVKGTEDIKAISLWYTKSEKNLEQIITLNGLTEPTNLAIGTRLIIPSALIKELKKMP